MMLDLSDFLGVWRVTREIEDHGRGFDAFAHPAGRMDGRFEGVARLTPDVAGLRYHESGTLTLKAEGVPPLVAARDYLWRRDGDRIEVLFADGRPFHAFRPEGRAPGTDHPCGRDLYRVAYDFTAWPLWTAEWTVTGPAKDYRMLSAFAPAETLAR